MTFDIDKSKRIQILRGISIIAVCFIHNTPSEWMQVVCRPFLNFSVAVFLFLSGILSHAEKWYPWKRIKKIIIPYAIWTFIYVLLNSLSAPEEIPLRFIKALLTASAAPMMYYVFVYCEFTILIPLIDKLGRSSVKYLGFLIAPTEIIIMRLLPIILHIERPSLIGVVMNISCFGWFTYFYLGYVIGNDLITSIMSLKKLFILLTLSILLQMAEGYWYLTMGEQNCGTQLKLSSIISGAFYLLLFYQYIQNGKPPKHSWLIKMGDISFAVYFSHMAVMWVLEKIPYYSRFAVYPLNALLTVAVTTILILTGKRILGNYGKYIAL